MHRSATQPTDGLSRIDGVIASLQQVTADLEQAIVRQGDRPGRPNTSHTAPPVSCAPQHYLPEPDPARQRRQERMLSWALAFLIGALLGITAGAQF